MSCSNSLFDEIGKNQTFMAFFFDLLPLDIRSWLIGR
jgi:hypothetical protein